MSSETSKVEPINAEFVDEKTQSEAIVSFHTGRLGAYEPKKAVSEAVEIANALAEVITSQELYTVIKKRKYVHLEGWSIVGGMMGVVPIEESVTPIEKGYEAKVKLIRIRDGVQVGGASSICTKNEFLWADREEYAVRSMAITRATSKAFRLSYGWLIKLAGFDPNPTEEASQIAAVEALQAYQTREAEAATPPAEKQKEVAQAKIEANRRQGHDTWVQASEDKKQPPIALEPSNKPLEPILEAVEPPSGKRRYAVITWGGQKFSCWKPSLAAELFGLIGQPLILHTKTSKDGEYMNVEGFELAPLEQSKR